VLEEPGRPESDRPQARRAPAAEFDDLRESDALEQTNGDSRALFAPPRQTPESVIQDVDIPIARAPEFLAFFLKEVGVLPVWICPIGG